MTKEPKFQYGKNIVRFVSITMGIGISVFLIFLSPRIFKALKALQYYNQGNALVEAGRYKEALTEFDRALYFRPDFKEASVNKIFVLEKLGHPEKIIACAQATNVNPDLAEAWNCRGLARYDLKQYEEALKEYEQAIALEPEFYRAWFNKGQVLLKLGKPKEAIDATRQVLKIKPDYFLAWTQLCRALYELEQYQDAKAHCEESISINPNYQPTQKLLEQIEQKLAN